MTPPTRSRVACTEWASPWSTRYPTTLLLTVSAMVISTARSTTWRASAPLAVVGATSERGTTIRFKPSSQIFTHIQFNYDTLAKRLRELSFLNSGVRISSSTNAKINPDVFQHDGGLKAFVAQPEPLAHAGARHRVLVPHTGRRGDGRGGAAVE